MTSFRRMVPVLACFFIPILAQGAEQKLTAKHAKAGLNCVDCHKAENPSKAAVPDESCMACHGDYPAMAAYTKSLPVNPHDPPKGKHPGPFLCTDCHHQHKAPEVKCLECHPDFKLALH